jgi:hypothetical protein
MSSNKVAWCGVWSSEHNNIRYSELLPRLESVDKYYVHLNRWWPVRGVQRRLWQPLLVRLLPRARDYRSRRPAILGARASGPAGP